jgi:hypothetical protein
MSELSTIHIHFTFQQSLIPMCFADMAQNIGSTEQIINFANYIYIENYILLSQLSPITPGIKLVFVWDNSSQTIEECIFDINNMHTVVSGKKYKGRPATILETIIYGIHFASSFDGVVFALGEEIQTNFGHKHYVCHEDVDGRKLHSYHSSKIRTVSNRFLVVFDEVDES